MSYVLRIIYIQYDRCMRYTCTQVQCTSYIYVWIGLVCDNIYVYIHIYFLFVCTFKYQSCRVQIFNFYNVNNSNMINKIQVVIVHFCWYPLERKFISGKSVLPVALWIEMKVSSQSYQKFIITAISEVISYPHRTGDRHIVLNTKYIYIFKIIIQVFMWHALIMVFGPQTIQGMQLNLFEFSVHIKQLKVMIKRGNLMRFHFFRIQQFRKWQQKQSD